MLYLFKTYTKLDIENVKYGSKTLTINKSIKIDYLSSFIRWLKEGDIGLKKPALAAWFYCNCSFQVWVIWIQSCNDK